MSGRGDAGLRVGAAINCNMRLGIHAKVAKHLLHPGSTTRTAKSRIRFQIVQFRQCLRALARKVGTTSALGGSGARSSSKRCKAVRMHDVRQSAIEGLFSGQTRLGTKKL